MNISAYALSCGRWTCRYYFIRFCNDTEIATIMTQQSNSEFNNWYQPVCCVVLEW